MRSALSFVMPVRAIVIHASSSVIPAQAGIQELSETGWIPAYAGMTEGRAGMTEKSFVGWGRDRGFAPHAVRLSSSLGMQAQTRPARERSDAQHAIYARPMLGFAALTTNLRIALMHKATHA